MISQKIEGQPSSRPSNTTFGYIPKRCSSVPQGHVLNYVHSSICLSYQEPGIKIMPPDQRMDKENVVHLHNGVFTTQQKKNY